MNSDPSIRAGGRPRPDDARGLLAWARECDPRGDRAHAVLVALAMVALPLGTTTFAIMFGIALGYSLLRLWATGPAVGYLLFRVPLVAVLAALLAWTCLSVLWSVDRSQAWDEIAILRFQVPALILFWPVIDRWRSYVLALSIGMALAALIQVGQFVLGESWPLALWWHGERIAGRYPGMLHPNSTAVLAVATIFLLPHVARGRSPRRLRAAVLAAAALLSLVLTGSRGCWIAAIAGLLASAPYFTLRALAARRAPSAPERAGRIDPAAERLRRIALVIVAPGVIAAGVFIGPVVVSRVSSGVSGLRAAIESKDYTGDVAARWRQIEITAALLRERPFTGVGAGSFYVAAREYVQAPPAQGAGTAPRGTGLLHHPHSALLYHAAVLGLPGLFLLAATWAMLFRADRAGPDGARVRPTFTPALAALLTAFVLDAHNLSAPGTIAAMLLASIILARRYAGEPSTTKSAPHASMPCA